MRLICCLLCSCLHESDVVTVFDGDLYDNHVMAQYCGAHNDEELLSKRSTLEVLFHTDSTLEGKGFSAYYEFVSRLFEKLPSNEKQRFPDYSKNSLKQ